MSTNKRTISRWAIHSAIAIIIIVFCVKCFYSINEPEIPAEEPNACLPVIMVDDNLYYIAGSRISVEIDENDYYGKIISVVANDEVPTINGQANFPLEGAPYVKYQDGIAVLTDEEWHIFRMQDDRNSLTFQEAKQLNGIISDRWSELWDKEDKTVEEIIVLDAIVDLGLYKDHEVIVTLLDDGDLIIELFKKYLLDGVDNADTVIFEKGEPVEPVVSDGIDVENACGSLDSKIVLHAALADRDIPHSLKLVLQPGYEGKFEPKVVAQALIEGNDEILSEVRYLDL